MGGCRRLGLMAAVLAVVAALASAGVGSAQSGGGDSEATIDADGWWSATPALPSTVGDQGLGVGARAGEPDKVAAVGIHLALASGARLAELVLELREVPGPGAVVPPGADAAVVRACPITRAWTPERNGHLAAAPPYDCGQASPAGVRDADGVWRFDLGAVARRWVNGVAPQHGVALVESVEPPASFQVAFQDRSTATPRLRLATSVAAPPTSEPGAAGAVAPTGTGVALPVAAGPAGGVAMTAPPLGATTAGGAPSSAGAEPEAAPSVPGRPAATASTPGVLDAVPAPALLLVPALLALALGACLVIGDDRSADEARRRQGAVSRALSRGAAAP